MSKGHTLQDPFLNVLRKDRIPVSIYLVNGIKLQGQIESFDQFVILLKNSVNQLVYKHAISTIVPARIDPLKLSPTPLFRFGRGRGLRRQWQGKHHDPYPRTQRQPCAPPACPSRLHRGHPLCPGSRRP